MNRLGVPHHRYCRKSLSLGIISIFFLTTFIYLLLPLVLADCHSPWYKCRRSNAHLDAGYGLTHSRGQPLYRWFHGEGTPPTERSTHCSLNNERESQFRGNDAAPKLGFDRFHKGFFFIGQTARGHGAYMKVIFSVLLYLLSSSSRLE